MILALYLRLSKEDGDMIDESNIKDRGIPILEIDGKTEKAEMEHFLSEIEMKIMNIVHQV